MAAEDGAIPIHWSLMRIKCADDPGKMAYSQLIMTARTMRNTAA
jgi:hypothetical protein